MNSCEQAMKPDPQSRQEFSPFKTFSRKRWAELRADTPMTLNNADLDHLAGVIERMAKRQVTEIYLPLSRLLNLHVAASQALHSVTSRFLDKEDIKTPFIIGMAGSVAVGKSTAARILRELLARWPHHPKVTLVSTDGFLFPNAVLKERDIMDRKGFPESFDQAALLQFLADVKSGHGCVKAPVYSHFSYDILPGEEITVDRPDILIVEGLNLLLPARLPKNGTAVPFVSDFFDFSIFVDADAKLIEEWYVERFMRLRQTAFRDPAAYFHRYSKLDIDAATKTARDIWRTINLVNLTEYILPTRQRADLILQKGPAHAIQSVAMRRL